MNLEGFCPFEGSGFESLFLSGNSDSKLSLERNESRGSPSSNNSITMILTNTGTSLHHENSISHVPSNRHSTVQAENCTDIKIDGKSVPSSSPTSSPQRTAEISPLREEHFQDMSRILSHYSAGPKYRDWPGAVNAKSKRDESNYFEEMKEENYWTEHNVEHKRHRRSPFSANYLSPLALFAQKSSASKKSKSVSDDNTFERTRRNEEIPESKYIESEDASYWRNYRCHAVSGEHDQWAEWVKQSEDIQTNDEALSRTRNKRGGSDLIDKKEK